MTGQKGRGTWWEGSFSHGEACEGQRLRCPVESQHSVDMTAVWGRERLGGWVQRLPEGSHI